jgi:flagellar motor switch protein FliN/FliY
MNILDIFKSKISETIKGLTGEDIEISDAKLCSFEEMEIDGSFCIAESELSGDYGGFIYTIVTTAVATSIASLMFAEDGNPKDTMEDDDLDSIKELISNVVTAAKNDIGIESTSNFTIDTSEIKFHQNISEIENKFSSIIQFQIKIKSTAGQIIVLFDSGANALLLDEDKGYGNSSADGGQNGSNNDNNLILKDHIADREIDNIKRILDIKINIKVRIGSKKMLLRDVINMDLGSVIELDRLINEPLDIMVDNKIVGRGEVVIVDGNFGIKVINMIDQKTRLESLRIQ